MTPQEQVPATSQPPEVTTGHRESSWMIGAVVPAAVVLLVAVMFVRHGRRARPLGAEHE